MKILVNAALIREPAKWFEFYPVYINGQLDTNSKEVFEQISMTKNNQTSFVNFTAIEEQIGKEEAIIFTIPQKLSGEYEAYQNLNQNQKITIISGEALISNFAKVKEIIEKHPNDRHKIQTKIKHLNQKIKMHALIWDLSTLPKKGRLQFVLKTLLHKAGFKMLLKWKNSQWEKQKLGRNGWKLIETNIANRKKLTFIAANEKEPYLLRIIEKCQKHFPDLQIAIEKITNAMMVHVGKSFLAFY